MSTRALEIADRVEAFVRNTVAPYEKDPRRTSHGPSDDLAVELKEAARKAGVL
ncbi:MAG: acyl-CoA dehydrogenase, partial [Pseudomonadota bacterium]|nr:acyl-CoA dehydrogenase [Pseudomonadota bacterium]